MYKTGVVVQVDEARACARVRFEDRDHLVSWWLQVIQDKTLKDKSYWLPDVGEHVACLVDENAEAGCVLGAIYSDADSTPVQSADKKHTTYADGGRIEYDRTAHRMLIDLSECAGTIHLKTGETEITLTPDGIVMRGPRIDLN